MTPTPPRRRSFQFGLRTMFVVVTLVAVGAWVTSEVRFIERRKQAIARIKQHYFHLVITLEECQKYTISEESHRLKPIAECAIPVWRRWLGDSPIRYIWLNNSAEPISDYELERLEGLFPETSIIRLS